MKLARNVAVGVLLLAAIVLLLETFGKPPLRKRAALVQIGDSKARVRLILGKPSASASHQPPRDGGMGAFLDAVLTEGYPEWWSYRTGGILHEFDWQPISTNLPWLVVPKMRISLFRPDEKEVAVYFDSSGRVAKVHIP